MELIITLFDGHGARVFFVYRFCLVLWTFAKSRYSLLTSPGRDLWSRSLAEVVMTSAAAALRLRRAQRQLSASGDGEGELFL